MECVSGGSFESDLRLLCSNWHGLCSDWCRPPVQLRPTRQTRWWLPYVSSSAVDAYAKHILSVVLGRVVCLVLVKTPVT